LLAFERFGGGGAVFLDDFWIFWMIFCEPTISLFIFVAPSSDPLYIARAPSFTQASSVFEGSCGIMGQQVDCGAAPSGSLDWIGGKVRTNSDAAVSVISSSHQNE
jgi:hypothetical protein